MIPLGIIAASSSRSSNPPLPGNGFELVQEWNAATGTNLATGPMLTPGNIAITRSVHRGGTGLAGRIGDLGGNTWYPVGKTNSEAEEGYEYVGVSTGGSGDMYFWWSLIGYESSEVNVLVGNGSVSRTVFVAEWAGGASEDVFLSSSFRENASQIGPLPVSTVETAVPGALVTGSLGAAVSNRTFDLLTPGYVSGREHRSSQTTLISAANPGVQPGVHGPQWSLGGSSASTAVITAAFRPA